MLQTQTEELDRFLFLVRKSAGVMDVMIENIWQCVAKLQNVQRTSWQVAYREAVLDTVAGLSGTPTLQAGVFLLRRLQHVVTAQTLKKEKAGGIFHGATLMFPCRDMGVRVILYMWSAADITGSSLTLQTL